MTAYGEAATPRRALSEFDVYAARLTGQAGPIPPNNPTAIAIEEVLARYVPGITETQPQTAFSAGEVSDWFARFNRPPVLIMLLTAHKLMTDEQDPRHKRNPQGARDMFQTAANWVSRRHGVHYINNVYNQAGPEEKSLAAWLLAESLVDLCDKGQIRQGCDILAGNVVVTLLELYAEKIRIEPSKDYTDTRPAGIELLDLCVQLNHGQDTAEAVGRFTDTSRMMRKGRNQQVDAVLHIKSPTSEPKAEAKRGLFLDAAEHTRLLHSPYDEVAEGILKTSDALKRAMRLGESVVLLLDGLATRWMVAKERHTVAPKNSAEAKRYGALCDMIVLHHLGDMVTYVTEELPSIDKGAASLGVQQLAYHLVYDQPFMGGEAEDALHHAARRWYRQSPNGQFTTKEPPKDASAGKFREIKLDLPPLSRSTGVLRDAGRLLIRTYLYHATALGCREDDSFNRRRFNALKESLPKNRQHRDLVLHSLPLAARLLFDK
ncbi:MAG TPA: hypothetical protein VFB59_03895 [Candidatus Saccharimonadales bacterium]|nr:hypothetical protein [Candidatus Saccharimonadales bacterium]